MWGCSSVGRASALHAEGRRFDSCHFHHIFERRIVKKIFYFLIIIIFLSFIPTIPIENEISQGVTTIEYKSVAEWAWEMYNAKPM